MVRLESKHHRHDIETSSNVSIHQDSGGVSLINLTGEDERSVCSEMPVNVGATAALPSVDKKEDQAIRLLTNSGELLVIEEQVHMYVQNSLLGHPLVSPALSYLGGLPPLLFIASDKEVLRDEAIYSLVVDILVRSPFKIPIKGSQSCTSFPLSTQGGSTLSLPTTQRDRRPFQSNCSSSAGLRW